MAPGTPRRLALAAFLVLLPTLGLLTWWAWNGLEDALQAETHQMRRFEELAAGQVVNNLGSELFHLYYTFNLGITAATGTDEWPRAVETVMATYRGQAHFPALLADVVLVADPPVGPRRWVSWTPDGWIAGGRPSWLPPAATLFDSSPDPLLDPDQPFLVFPLPRWKELRQTLVVRWSVAAVTDRIVPTLVEAAFSSSPLYKVEVRRAAFRYGLTTTPGWDLTLPLVPRMRFSQWLQNYLGRTMTEPLPYASYGQTISKWVLVVRREPAGLEAVAEVRRQTNLAAVAGVLGLLTLSLGLLVLSLRGVLQSAERERSFSSLVSHELKTPLSAIRSLSENLADGVAVKPERVKDYGQALLDQTRRLNELVENILALAVLQSSEAHLAREVFDLAETAWEVASLHSLAVGGEPGPRLVRGNRAAVRAALDNLVTNALRHGAKDGEEPLVAVGLLGRLRWGQSWLGVAVTDHGPGLTPRERRQLFRPYRRGRRAGDRQTPGGGVGLSLVRATVRQLGGRIELRPVPGGGLTFTLWLTEGGRR